MNQDNLKKSSYPQSEEQEIGNILSSIRELIADEVKNDPTIDKLDNNNNNHPELVEEKNNEKKVLELTNSIDDMGFNSSINNENPSIEDIDMVNFEDTATATPAENETDNDAGTTTIEVEDTQETSEPTKKSSESTKTEASESNAQEGSDAKEASPEIDESMLEKIDTLEVGGADIDVEGANENENSIESPEEKEETSMEISGLESTEIDEAAINTDEVGAEVVGGFESEPESKSENEGIVIDAASISNGLKEGIVSQETIAKAAEALGTLESLTERSAKAIELDRKIGQKTVDELMQEILRPLLKEWLDSNLPSLVKWVVTEQVEKLIREKTKEN